jgi:hypothetical protein
MNLIDETRRYLRQIEEPQLGDASDVPSAEDETEVS